MQEYYLNESNNLKNEELHTSDSNYDTNILKNNKLDLPYSKVSDISFTYFLSETLYFSINYFMDRLTFIITYILFRIGGFTKATVISGLIVLAVDLLFCFARDFQEAIGIVLGPFYSKGDAQQYYFFLMILIFWNIVFFLICLPSIYYLQAFFTFLGANPKLVELSSYVTRMYILSACSFLCISNFIKGLINIKQLHKYNVYSTLSGLIMFSIVSVVSILGFKKPYYGFTFAFVAKYVTEIIFNIIIINFYGKT
jgi:hypothetical protein